MKKALLFVLATLVMAWSVSGVSFYDDFENNNFTVDGWTNIYPTNPMQEINGVLKCTTTGGCAVWQDFSPTIDFSTDVYMEWNDTTETGQNVYYAGLILTSTTTPTDKVYIFIQDALDSFMNDDLRVYCSGGCSCVDSRTYITPETVNHTGKVYLYPDTGLVRLLNQDDIEVNTTVSGCNLSNMGNVTAWVRWVNKVNMTEFLISDSGGNPPVIVDTLPADNSRTNNASITYSFTATDDNVSVMSCDIVIDGSINYTNASVLNNTVTTTVITVAEGIHTSYINCTDGTLDSQSSTVTYELDTTEPFIQTLEPLFTNTTVYTGYWMSIKFNVTDNALFRVNHTIFFPNSSVFYNNFSGNLSANTTVYSWAFNFNSTLLPNGQYRLLIEASDSHTRTHLRPANNVEKDQTARKLRYVFDDADISVQLIGGNKLGQFDGIDTEKLDDRYTFNINYKNALPPNTEQLFRLASDQDIYIVEGSEYNGHMVTGDYWIDFAGVDADIRLDRVSDTEVDITVTNKETNKEFRFESLGGLNENQLDITYQVNNCIPNWICSDYGSCNTTDLAPCTNITDTNACGLPDPMNASSYPPQSCDYCDDDLVFMAYGLCNQTINIRSDNYTDNNFATCCNITNLIPSDCPFGAVQGSGTINVSCTSNYISSYASSDLPEVAINGLVVFLIAMAGLTGVIGLVLVFRWARVRLK